MNSNNSNVYNVIIVGSGPAGLTAAIYTGRAHLSPLVIAGNEPGGQLMGTTAVDNFPGFPQGILGPELMQNMIRQAERFGAKLINQNATKLELADSLKKVFVNDTVYTSKTVILAMGSSPRRLGLPAEQKFWGRGVSTCATCDGAFYKDKVVAVVGGGDSAAEESTFLTKFATKVYVLVRKDFMKASKIMQDKVFSNPKIEVLWNTEVVDILGEQTVTGLMIKNNKTNDIKELKVDGMFLAIGHEPNTELVKEQLELDSHGYIKTQDCTTKTSLPGVFVAGDIYDYKYKQAITSAGMGCKAAIDAELFIHTN